MLLLMGQTPPTDSIKLQTGDVGNSKISKIIRGCVAEDSTATLRARLVDSSDNLITQSQISSISYTVFDDDLETIIDSGTASVLETIYNTLQTWDLDDVGFNFKHSLLETAFPLGDKVYRVEYKLITVFGDFFLLFDVSTTGVSTS